MQLPTPTECPRCGEKVLLIHPPNVREIMVSTKPIVVYAKEAFSFVRRQGFVPHDTECRERPASTEVRMVPDEVP